MRLPSRGYPVGGQRVRRSFGAGAEEKGRRGLAGSRVISGYQTGVATAPAKHHGNTPTAAVVARLANLCNVRTALADALWGLETDLVEPSKARVLLYGYSVQAEIIQGTDLEKRIESLELAIKEHDDATA